MADEPVLASSSALSLPSTAERPGTQTELIRFLIPIRFRQSLHYITSLEVVTDDMSAFITASLFEQITTLAVSLNCSFNILIPAYVGEIYHCMGRRMDIGYDERLTAVNGIHLPGKGNTDVKGLTVSNNELAFILVNIEEFFPNIVYLDFALNQISYVNSSHLNPFPNLLRLNLNSNKIVQLDSKLFSHTKSIKFINFSHNNVRHVGHDFILPDSGEVLFSSNPCIDKTAINPDQIIGLRFSLLLNCPPTISQIETTLEGRNNLITKVNDKVNILEMRTDYVEQSQSEINVEFQILSTRLSNVCVQLEDLFLITDTLGRNYSNIDTEIKTLTSILTNISSKMQDLFEKTDTLDRNQLEMRLDISTLTNRIATYRYHGQLLILRTDRLEESLSEMTDELKTHKNVLKDVRDKNVKLEERVALLESVIENKFGIKIEVNESEDLN